MPTPDRIFVGTNTEIPKISPLVGPYTKLTVVTGEKDEEGKDIAYSIGTDDGLELTVSNKYANETMVRNMGAIFLGMEYQPFDAENTILDPAAEIGDFITIGSIFSGIHSIVNHIEPLYLAQPMAPFNDEYESEYPYKTLQQREYSREKSATRTSLTIMDQRIEAEVTRATTEEGTLSSRITQTSEAITSEVSRAQSAEGDLSSRITQTASEVESRITSDEAESLISQGIDEITLEVSGSGYGGLGASIVLKRGDEELGSGEVRITGVVTFENLETAGETVINGDNITTGTVAANNIAVEDIATVNRSLVLGGGDQAYAVLEFGNTESNTYLRTSSSDNDLEIHARNLEVIGTRNLSLAAYDSALTLQSGETFELTSGNGVSMTSYTSTIITSEESNIYLYPSNSGYVQINEVLSGHNSLRPETDDSLTLGASSYRWSTIYSSSSSISTSDREKKKDISYNLSAYDRLFDMLRPVSYKMKTGTSGRKHIGLIAQDIEDILSEVGLTPSDFAGFCKDEHTDSNDIWDGTYDYGLRYEEFIGLLIRQVQLLKERVSVLENGR